MPETPSGAPYPPGTGVPPNVPLWLQSLAEWASEATDDLAGSLDALATDVNSLVISRGQSITVRHTMALAAGWVSASSHRLYTPTAKMVAFDGGMVTRTTTLAFSGGARTEVPYHAAGPIPAAYRPLATVRSPALLGLSGILNACMVEVTTAGQVFVTPYASGNLLGTASAEQNFLVIPPLHWTIA